MAPPNISGAGDISPSNSTNLGLGTFSDMTHESSSLPTAPDQLVLGSNATPKEPASELQNAPRLKRMAATMFRTAEYPEEDGYATFQPLPAPQSTISSQLRAALSSAHSSSSDMSLDSSPKSTRDGLGHGAEGRESRGKPSVHYFGFAPKGFATRRKRGLHGKEEEEVVIVGFNNYGTWWNHLKQDCDYNLVRLSAGSTAEIAGDENLNPSVISGYMVEIKKRREAKDRSGKCTTAGSKLHPTMGWLIHKGVKEEFALGADDLVVLEAQEEVMAPWRGINFPFAHYRHFERTQLKHFAFEYTAVANVDFPPQMVCGCYLWLIDYDFVREAKYAQKTMAQGHRFKFYGPGVRLVEVREEDVEWTGSDAPQSALYQCEIWREKREIDMRSGFARNIDRWPSHFGVLALEVGDFEE